MILCVLYISGFGEGQLCPHLETLLTSSILSNSYLCALLTSCQHLSWGLFG